MQKCSKCEKILTKDETGLNKKIYTLDESKMLCYDCLALMFNVSKDQILKKVEEFKKSGCMFFN